MDENRGNRHGGAGEGPVVGVVVGCFYQQIAQDLLDGAMQCLEERGWDPERVEIVRVPGAWEIPLALDLLARRGRSVALVALGAVVRGETPHFEYISAECARGVARVTATHGIPVGFGVLTCETIEQARARSAPGDRNKGREAAAAALEMADLARKLEAE